MLAADGPAVGESASGFTILLIAYEFPPSPSPQSLRWAYLARELALRGHRIHVLAPEHPGSGDGLPVLPGDVIMHRTFAGPAMGLLNVLARRGRRRAGQMEATVAGGPAVGAGAGPPATAPEVGLNWKGRLHNAFNRCRTVAFHAIQRWSLAWCFPDGRAEWYPWARRRLARLLDQLDLDIVVSSHEPATTLSLGLAARRKGHVWVADLGDPVLAPYTPPRWRGRALRLERQVCMEAARVVVTTPAAAQILRERHGIPQAKLAVLTQGFDGRVPAATSHPRVGAEGQLELLYTGSFYSFRRCAPLIEAVLTTPGVRLNIASIAVPEDVRAASERSSSIRLLGFLPHSAALAWQRRCDVLVNLANDDPGQVPGKFYEYLGAGRPILHIGNCADAAADLLLEIRRGWVCRGESGDLARTLVRLRDDALAGRLGQSLDLSAQAVRTHDWTAIAGRFDEMMKTLMAERGK